MIRVLGLSVILLTQVAACADLLGIRSGQADGGGSGGENAAGNGGEAGGGAGQGGGTPAPWLDAAYTGRMRLTLETTASTVDIQSFPVAVVLTAPAMSMAAFNDGRDLAFTADDGVKRLPHEIEAFEHLSGSLVAWVLLERVYAQTPTDVYVYWGDPNATVTNNATAVWTPDRFRSVWHLSQNPTLPGAPLLDSSGHETHGSVQGDPAPDDGVAGPALFFDGVGDRANFEDPGNALDFELGSFSVSLWAFVTVYTGMGDTLLYKGAGGRGWLLDTNGPPGVWYANIFDTTTGAQANFGSDANLLGKWTQLVAVVNRETAQVAAYVDGKFVGPEVDLNVGIVDNSGPLTLCPGGNVCTGIIDEVRVYEGALSPDWIALEHQNLASEAFVTTGPPELAD